MHFRSILVVTLPLPLAVLCSFLLMHYAHVTSNVMSLAGIAIAIGVLVDAGIVDMNAVTIGHLAKESEVNLEIVRYYERRGLLSTPPRNACGYRLFPKRPLR